MAQVFFGGSYPGDMKAATSEKAIEQLAPPARVILSLSQHVGDPCRPLVTAGDRVKVGQRIGEARDGDGTPVHASVSGTVTAVEPRPCAAGGNALSVVIQNDFQDELSGEVRAPESPESLTVEQMIAQVENAGVVGMGGVPFPTHRKISDSIGRVNTVIINGAECEPYVTSDHRAMVERPEEIVGGAACLAKMFGVDKVYLGVDAGRQSGIDALARVIAERKAPVVVDPLRRRYPLGAERQLCRAVTGRRVPPGASPVEVGCAVFNINTVRAVYRAVVLGLPVIRKIVTVSGSGVLEPKNLECPVGTPISDLLDACGGLRDTTYKLVMGGPMMGTALTTAEIPVNKGTGAVLAFCENEERASEHAQCIRCGRCISVCPMHLEPLMLYQFASRDLLAELEDAGVMNCMECGACTYICPARLHLTQAVREGKRKLLTRAAEREA